MESDNVVPGEALCDSLDLENSFFLKSKKQAQHRQAVKAVIEHWKSVFMDETSL